MDEFVESLKGFVKTIGKHIAHALREELEGISVVAKFATVQKEGNRVVNHCISALCFINTQTIGKHGNNLVNRFFIVFYHNVNLTVFR